MIIENILTDAIQEASFIKDYNSSITEFESIVNLFLIRCLSKDLHDRGLDTDHSPVIIKVLDGFKTKGIVKNYNYDMSYSVHLPKLYTLSINLNSGRVFNLKFSANIKKETVN